MGPTSLHALEIDTAVSTPITRPEHTDSSTPLTANADALVEPRRSDGGAAPGMMSHKFANSLRKSGRLELMMMAPSTRNLLSRYDLNGDGRLDAQEVEAVVEKLVQEEMRSRRWRLAFAVGVLFLLVLLGCTLGIMWAVMLAHKDTQVKGGVLLVRGTNEPVQVGSVSYAVNRTTGALSARGSGAALATGELLRRRPLHSGMGLGQLQGLTRVLLRSSRGAELTLRVTGVVLVPRADAGASPASSPSPSSAATSLHISTPGGVLQVVGGELRAGGVAPGMAGEEGDTWTAIIGLFSS